MRTAGAYQDHPSKGCRKWSSSICKNDKDRTKGSPCGPHPSSYFLLYLLCHLGQEPHQHQIGWGIPIPQVLHRVDLCLVLFFCLYPREPVSILAVTTSTKLQHRFAVSTVSQNSLRDLTVTSSLTKASPHARSVPPSIASTYRKYSLPLRPGCIASTLGDRYLHSLLATQVYRAQEARGPGNE